MHIGKGHKNREKTSFKINVNAVHKVEGLSKDEVNLEMKKGIGEVQSASHCTVNMCDVVNVKVVIGKRVQKVYFHKRKVGGMLQKRI